MTTPYVGMIVTAIEVDADGFYNAENADVQIITDISGKTITTISMKDPDGVNKPFKFVDNTSTTGDTTYYLVFDQNNSPELTLKAIGSKPELLRFPGIQTMVTDQYMALATAFQVTPNELKLLNSFHEAIVKRFSVRFKPKTETETAVKPAKLTKTNAVVADATTPKSTVTLDVDA